MEAGGCSEKERRQRRLEKNRESARECRARKKAKVLALHQQLAKLETDNLHLRLQLTGAAAGTAAGTDATSGATTGPDAASPFSSLEAMIDKGASEKEIQDAIKELQERFSDYGRDRTSAFAFHLSQLKRCLLPTQTTRTMLWLMRCAMQYLSSEGEINYTPPTPAGAGEAIQTTHSTEVVELLTSLLQTIKPTKEQRKQLVSLTSIYSGAPQSGIDFSDEMIQRLGILVKDKNELLDSEMSNISRILSATQIAKFILWIDANPLIMQMLESFWPHIAVNSST